MKSHPVISLMFGLTFPQLWKGSSFTASAWLLGRSRTCQNNNTAPTQSKLLTFRFSRFRTFFSTIVRHCFSVDSLASEAITLSCVTQSDGILSAKIITMCYSLSSQTTGCRRHCVICGNRAACCKRTEYLSGIENIRWFGFEIGGTH